jgi:phosphate transport system substrate-binding protein
MMRKLIVMTMVLGIVAGGCAKKPQTVSSGAELQGKISLSGAFALYPMAVKWAEEFRKIHAQVQIDIAAGGAGKGMADCLSGTVDLGMVSRAINPAELEKGAFPLAVTKDAVVPTINRNNPAIAELLARGITKQQASDIWITGKITTWAALSAGKCTEPIHIFNRSDACGAAETWAQYMGKKQEDLTGFGVFGDPGVVEAVKKDPLGIGYNNVNFAYDAATKKPMDAIAVLPLDINGNGKIDPEESFYDTRDALTRAIATGQYPSPPARVLYLVSKGKPKDKVLVEFLKWILVEGQGYVSESGYVNLAPETIQAELKKLKD